MENQNDFMNGAITGLIILGIGTIIFMLLVPIPKYSEQEIAIGFANQTCIDKNLTFNKIKYVENIPTIICNKPIETKNIDGTKYMIKVR